MWMRRHAPFAADAGSLYSPAAMLQSHHPDDPPQDPPKAPVPPYAGQPIVLIGLMGAGKTTVGRRLAQRMRLPFVDADHEIEAAAGMSVADIFERFGEPYFRDGERRVIARLIDGIPKVIATGGGAFMHEATRALILDQSIAIWLDAEPAVLADRVSRRDTRPLLRGGDPQQLLTQLAAVRNPFYALAPIRVESVVAPHDATVDAILKAIHP